MSIDEVESNVDLSFLQFDENALGLFLRAARGPLLPPEDIFSAVTKNCGFRAGDVTDIVGDDLISNELLRSIAVYGCVPSLFGGRETKVFVIECSLSSKLSMEDRFPSMVLERVKGDAAIASQSVARVKTLRCFSSLHFVAILNIIASECRDNVGSSVLDSCILIVDNVSSFYWEERGTVDTSSIVEWGSILKQLCKECNLVCFSHHLPLVGGDIRRSFLPKHWEKNVTHRLLCWLSSSGQSSTNVSMSINNRSRLQYETSFVTVGSGGEKRFKSVELCPRRGLVWLG